jgi:4,5-DOPA dioxygenase extradiol
MQQPRMPVLFVGHGSPMNAIEDNYAHRSWQALAARLTLPRAIVCVSAHWETPGVCVTAASSAPTIHDFYGFPKALFDVQYPATGAPKIAQRIAELLQAHTPVYLEPLRGLDHGAWGVLCVMYPQANVPVVQLSLDTRASGLEHYEIAKKLAPLRDEGVLVLASGNWVHNLRLFNFHDLQPLPWALAFDAQIKQFVVAGDHAELCAFQSLANSQLAIPTPEHYLPLLYAIALQAPDDRLTFFNATVQSAIAMTSVVIGEL